MAAVIEFIGLYDQNVIRPKSFIKDSFFKIRKTSESQKMEVEYRNGKKYL